MSACISYNDFGKQRIKGDANRSMMLMNITFSLIGRRLGQDIYGKNGVLLMRSGTLLAEQHIKLIQNHGIKQISIL